MLANNRNGKGKGRAVEQTPLLDEHGNSSGETCSGEPLHRAGGPRSRSRTSTRRAWRSHLLTVVLVLLTLFLGFLLGIILLTESYAAPALRTINKALSQPEGDKDKFLKEAVLLHGPEAVKVADIHQQKDDSGVVQLEVNMSVTMRLAVDTDFIMGFRQVSADDDGWWTKRWKELGRWGVRQLGVTTLLVDNITVFPSPPSAPLLVLEPSSPIAIPLSPGLSAEDHLNPPSSIPSVSIPLLIRPSQNASLLLHFVEQSWAHGFARVHLQTSSLLVYGGHERLKPPKWWQFGRWRNWLRVQRSEITLDIELPIPPLHIPSHPPSSPGSELPPLSDLLTLESFSIASAPSRTTPRRPFPSSILQSPLSPLSYTGARGPNADVTRVQASMDDPRDSSSSMDVLTSPRAQDSPAVWNLLISAQVSLVHPFSNLGPKLDLGHGSHTLPLIISLPATQPRNASASAFPYSISSEQHMGDLIPVAQVYASPTFNATHISIPLAGYVLPFSNLSSPHLPDAISSFVSSYLSYKPSSVAIFTPLYPSLIVRALFPPPSDRLELLRDLEIENMRIHPGLGSIYIPPKLDSNEMPLIETPLTALAILASATIHARVVLPAGMDVDIKVARVWIDCLIFDGEAPPEDNMQRGNDVLDEINTNDEDAYNPPSGAAGEPPVPKPQPLPHPLPVRAFARITPKNWLNSTSLVIPPKEKHFSDAFKSGADEVADHTGTNIYVTAEMVDVPLEVLPGREGDLSRFVTKVLFSREPVVAGIRGVAAVGVGVPGLTIPTSLGQRVGTSELVLTGLPFEGTMHVGGRKL